MKNKTLCCLSLKMEILLHFTVMNLFSLDVTLVNKVRVDSVEREPNRQTRQIVG